MKVTGWTPSLPKLPTKIPGRAKVAVAVCVGAFLVVKVLPNGTVPEEYFDITLAKTVATDGDPDGRDRYVRGAASVGLYGTTDGSRVYSMVTLLPLVDGIEAKQMKQTAGGAPCTPPACTWRPGSAQQELSNKFTSFAVYFELDVSGEEEFRERLEVRFEARKNDRGEVEFQNVTVPETDGIFPKSISRDKWRQFLGTVADLSLKGLPLPHATFALGVPNGLPDKSSQQALQVTSSVSSPGGLGF